MYTPKSGRVILNETYLEDGWLPAWASHNKVTNKKHTLFGNKHTRPSTILVDHSLCIVPYPRINIYSNVYNTYWGAVQGGRGLLFEVWAVNEASCHTTCIVTTLCFRLAKHSM